MDQIAKSPVRKETVTTLRPPAPSISAPPAPGAKSDSAAKDASPVTPERRRIMIAEAAYYLAEQRGFEVGHDVEDWLVAEQRIDAVLTG